MTFLTQGKFYLGIPIIFYDVMTVAPVHDEANRKILYLLIQFTAQLTFFMAQV